MLIEEFALLAAVFAATMLLVTLPVWAHRLPAWLDRWKHLGETPEQRLRRLQERNKQLSSQLWDDDFRRR